MGQNGTGRLAAKRRIGVIGDIHTEVDVLRWALDTLRAQDVELILATGDIADGPQHESGVEDCCKLLREQRVHVVSGNHDRWMLDNDMRTLPDATTASELDAGTREFLRSLPSSIEVETPLGLMLFGHGLGGDDMATLFPHDRGVALRDNSVLQTILDLKRYKLLCHGHTHQRMVRIVDDVIAINAGALLRKREPCCLVLDFEARKARFLDYGEGGKIEAGPELPLV
ncbi:MAG TPA: metallophosphoesterase family protein [Polyangiales bacterium]|jgi:predicted phosphodiesterase|nr:metallophosphoesterase family protein [Polyangiales bacterium]